MAIVSFAETTWSGSLEGGGGSIDYVSSGAFSRMPVSWSARTESHRGKTSPEELLAAAHASCFSMSLSGRLARNGTVAERIDVRAEVTFEKGDAGWSVRRSAL